MREYLVEVGMEVVSCHTLMGHDVDAISIKDGALFAVHPVKIVYSTSNLSFRFDFRCLARRVEVRSRSQIV